MAVRFCLELADFRGNLHSYWVVPNSTDAA